MEVTVMIRTWTRIGGYSQLLGVMEYVELQRASWNMLANDTHLILITIRHEICTMNYDSESDSISFFSICNTMYEWHLPFSSPSTVLHVIASRFTTGHSIP